MRKSGLLIAILIVIVSNAFVLVGVARNRAGTPVETIQLTQRELPKGYQQKEDTGISLRLTTAQNFFQPQQAAWLDRAKLESLGFDASSALRNPKHQFPRPAFVVLEYNGPAWDRWLEQAQSARYFNASRGDTASHLFAIDADKSPEPLLQKYSDRRKYLIVRGVVRSFVNATSGSLEGSVSEILSQSIYVDPSLANAFTPTNYTVTLAYGHRFEPWVIGP